MADPQTPATAADVVTQPAADTTSPAEAAVGGVQLNRHSGDRVGAKAIGVEYGNPYDENTPPHSVYRDPMRATLEQREAEEQAEEDRKAKARGTEFRFDGHESPYEWTEELKTHGGTARIGETVVMSKADADALQARGYLLTKVEKADSK